jgi:hypothetical protein
MLYVQHEQMNWVIGLTNNSGIVFLYSYDMVEAKQSR